LSAVAEAIPSGVTRDVMGPRPVAYVIFTPGGRLMLMGVDPGRKRPEGEVPTPGEARYLYSSMIAYGGTYAVNGREVVYDLDISWNQAWTGTKQLRYWEIRDGRLIISTPEFTDPFIGGRSVHRITWEKIE
jgi:hypothetical protein